MKLRFQNIESLIYSFVLSMFVIGENFAQIQTLGLFINSQDAQNGYTLLAPTASRETYLIDNCGLIVNQWTSDYQAGAVAYLLENGNLLRAGSVSGSFQGGGRGGIIEQFDWEGNLVWSYRVADQNQHQHHDLEYLPNGNILLIAWEKVSAEDAKEAGVVRNITPAGIWPDMVLELKPIGNDDAEIVWEWHIWDHIVQDVDSLLPTFGIIADHPELIDMNLSFGAPTNSDWNHCNSIDYNAELDQIVLSSRNFDEIWVIDHSTTTEESSGHEGGKYGKGGDILYRWGNPQNYDRGAPSLHVFGGQHDAHWIEGGEHKGKLMVFNNAVIRTYSSVDVIDQAVDSNGFYLLEDNAPYGPEALHWSYGRETGGRNFSVGRTSGADFLPNGNLLVSNGITGLIWEVGPDNQVVWEYQNPVNLQPASQGQPAGQNAIFRAYKYPTFFPGFEGKDLSPGLPIELNPFDLPCVLFTSASEDLQAESPFDVFPNPTMDRLHLKHDFDSDFQLLIYNIHGKEIKKLNLDLSQKVIDVSDIAQGIYIINAISKKNKRQLPIKFIKQ